MRPKAIERQVRWLERPLPWLAVGMVSLIAVAALTLALHLGLLEKLDATIFGNVLRGYTVLGLVTGILAFVLAGLTLAYSLRKRAAQERLALFRSTMMTWLWSHVTFGLLALLLVTFHGGYGIISLHMSTGKVAFALLLLLVVSGVVWRLVYQVVPARAAPQVGNYAEEGSLHRAQEQLTEIEKIAAGKSPQFRALSDALLSQRVHPTELPRHLAAFAPQEQAAMGEIARLAMSRDRAVLRARLQKKYSFILQSWRLLHIPLTILFVPAALLHVAFALDLPAKLLVREFTPPAFSGFESADQCASCHRAFYDQWKLSMHAHAMTSPVMIAQTNQLLTAELSKAKSPDPRGICVNCHGPVGVIMADNVTLPLRHSMGGDALLNEGISCSVCHQYQGKPTPGQGGLSRFQDGYEPGTSYLGPIRDPVGNAHHQSQLGAVYRNPDDLCVGCHNVSYDKNGDGKIVKGQDLVLQVTDEEYQEYRAAGGTETCITCHMPRLKKDRVAESAAIPLEQDREAPPRAVHDHSFVGVDYPLDEVATRDPRRPLREALLRSAAKIDVLRASVAVRPGTLAFDVAVSNTGTGHYVPTGFAFARQMWIEVTVADASGALFTSGALANGSSDLCDAASLDEVDNPMRSKMTGCERSDPQLVNFQKKLVDHFEVATDKQGLPAVNEKGELKIVQASGAHEEWLQRLSVGVVNRLRPSDKQPMNALKPGETRTFRYTVPLPSRTQGELKIAARLLFRSLPPYMLRAMAAHQPPDEKPRLEPLVQNLQIVEMGEARLAVGTR